MALARKILRFGPSINCVKTFILNTITLVKQENKESTPIFILKTLSALWIALFFVCDHYLWLFRVHSCLSRWVWPQMMELRPNAIITAYLDGSWIAGPSCSRMSSPTSNLYFFSHSARKREKKTGSSPGHRHRESHPRHACRLLFLEARIRLGKNSWCVRHDNFADRYVPAVEMIISDYNFIDDESLPRPQRPLTGKTPHHLVASQREFVPHSTPRKDAYRIPASHVTFARKFKRRGCAMAAG